MITKNDCMSILIRLEDKGVNIDSYMAKLAMSKEVPLDVLKFIASNQGLEAVNFYEMLRINHNKNKSPLYTNLLKEQSDISEAVVTLSCLLTQIALYSKKLENKDAFLKEIRAEEITRVLNNYYKDSSNLDCLVLLKLIRTDVVVLDYINGRRELN